MTSSENGIIYVQDSILKASFLEALDIFGDPGKHALLKELFNFGVIHDSPSEDADTRRGHSLENIESALSKIIGTGSSSLIMIKVKRLMKEKGWNAQEIVEPEFSY